MATVYGNLQFSLFFWFALSLSLLSKLYPILSGKRQRRNTLQQRQQRHNSNAMKDLSARTIHNNIHDPHKQHASVQPRRRQPGEERGECAKELWWINHQQNWDRAPQRPLPNPDYRSNTTDQQSSPRSTDTKQRKTTSAPTEKSSQNLIKALRRRARAQREE